MVSLTFSITLTRSSTDNNYSPPASLHQYNPSIYSTHERRYSCDFSNFNLQSFSRQTSREGLIQNGKAPSGRRERFRNKHLALARGESKGRRMPDNHDIGERMKSYGIGGFGNIRKPSEVIYPERVNADGTRRRSSVWSCIAVSPGTTPDGRRLSILSFFRKGSVQNESPSNAVVVEEE